MRLFGNRYRISFGIRQLLIFIAVIALALGTWKWLIAWQYVGLSDSEITQETVLKFKGWRDPVALKLRITGEIDGRALITSPFEVTAVGPGKFQWSESGDHYERDAVVRYSPETVSKGYLKVYYDFDAF